MNKSLLFRDNRLLPRDNKLVSLAKALVLVPIIENRKNEGLQELQAFIRYESEEVQPPKLSYMMDSGSTPSESSIWTTAFDIGPGPHM